MTNIIDGKKIADTILNEIRDEIICEINDDIEKNLVKPKLAVIQVGNKKASSIYIKKKCEACQKVGIDCEVHYLEDTIADEKLVTLIDKLNSNTNINAILVQLPIPKHLNESLIMSKIDYSKDVDGFHSQNIGNLAMEKREPLFIPCTPFGCLELLKREHITIKGKHAVIVGKSNIVGMPMALLLLKEMATVTVCHIETTNIIDHLKMADIVVSACGQAQMIKKDWLKEGVVIIDVGMNSITDGSKKSGYRLVGDVDYEEVKTIASKITPVPGGVGPMTVAMLLANTLKAYKYQNQKIQKNDNNKF
jgi:5,10-methylene-tetrahydrofolate dehydrogenase/methenyl tetrahydrofolate cyclohydrolase